MTRVLFVCLGNICRSPTAEAIFKKMVAEAGLDADFTIDSAGTGAWHAGQPADRRMRLAAKKRGYDLTSIARQVEVADFETFDRIIAMDRDNERSLRAICPKAHQEKIEILRRGDADADVPDPYYGGPDGFVEVIDIVEAHCARLLDALR